MNTNTSNSTVPAFPFLPILTLIFIALKLTGFIAWNWFWVLSPILIPTIFAVGLFMLIGLAIAFKR